MEASETQIEKPKKKRDLSFARAKAEAIRKTAYQHPDELKKNIEIILGHALPDYKIEELKGDTLTDKHKKNISLAQIARHSAEEQLKIRHPDEYGQLKADILTDLEVKRAQKFKQAAQAEAAQEKASEEATPSNVV